MPFLCPYTETIKWDDGNEYPLVKLEISSFSHPFFDEMKFVDTAGRIEKFKKRMEITSFYCTVILFTG